MTSPVSKPKLMTARVTRRVDVTHDLWQIWVKPEVPFAFKPGQYCTIGVDGLERPYSIVSAPYEDEIELFIELVPVPDGRLTPVLHDLGEGAELTIRPRAKGLFFFKEDYRDHLMVATVTGVVPYVSILRQYLHEGREGHRFFLLVGASYKDEFTYDGELRRLADEHPDFIKFIPTISRPGEEKNASWTGETGRVNTIVGKYVQEFGLKHENTLIYACGHPGMIEDVKMHASEIGFDFQEERFWKEDD